MSDADSNTPHVIQNSVEVNTQAVEVREQESSCQVVMEDNSIQANARMENMASNTEPVASTITTASNTEKVAIASSNVQCDFEHQKNASLQNSVVVIPEQASKEEIINDVREIVRKEIQDALPEVVASACRMIGMSQSLAISQQNDSLHLGITCDKCLKTPIQGVRYKCSICYDFDLCATCEIEFPHEHALLKINRPLNKAPQQHPHPQIAESLIKSQYYEDGLIKKSIFVKKEEAKQEEPAQAIELLSSKLNAQNPPVTPNGKAYLMTSPSFYPQFTLENNGNKAWPKDTVLRFIGGVEPCDTAVKIHEEVKPGETASLTVKFMKPEKDGDYDAIFTLQSGDFAFGELCHVKFMVNSGEEAYQLMHSFSQEERKKFAEKVKTLRDMGYEGEDAYLYKILKEADGKIDLAISKIHK